jgi:uncharacterized protein involved in exopolysaccharide biosynthesis
MVNDTAERDDFAAINLLRMWRALAAHKLLIAVFAVVTPVVAVGVSYLIQPTFRADTLLASAGADRGGGGLSGLLGQYGGLASLAGIDVKGLAPQSLDESIEILRSRSFTESFIVDNKLLPVLFPGKRDKPPTMWDAYKRFNGIRKVAKDSTTGFFKLSIEWTDPKLAASWANQLVSRLNSHMRTRTIEEATRSVGYLQEQLEATIVTERRQMLVRLMENETQKIMLAKAQEDFAVRVLDRAVPPQEKVAPKRLLILISALLAGIVIGAIVALVRNWLVVSKRAHA